MSELILHIGGTKTGSSSLQAFFFDNRQRLAKHGVLVPTFMRQRGTSPKRTGQFLNRYCFVRALGWDPDAYVEDVSENLQRLARSCDTAGRVLLSEEGMSHLPSQLVKARLSPSRYWQVLAQVARESGAQAVTIVVYLRRQDDWLVSFWREQVKDGQTVKGLDAFGASPSRRHQMDYAAVLASIVEAFDGRAKVVVRRYQRVTFQGGDIYRDFCAAADIPWDEAYRLPEEDVNPSLSFDVAEALRPFAVVAPASGHTRMRTLIPLAMDLSARHPDLPATTPFDEDQTRRLMQPYVEGNRHIAKSYLDGGPLFLEEYGDRPVWNPDLPYISSCREAFSHALKNG